MTYCVVKGCHNSTNYRKKDEKITFHSIPSDPILAARWIEKIRLNRKESSWKPSKATKICSKHFCDSDKYITKRGLCKIREGAFPTKELHICCTEDHGNNLGTNDNITDPLELCEPRLGCSPNGSGVDIDICTTSTPQQHQVINSNEWQTSPDPLSQNSDIDSDPDSIFDTPRERKLRIQLKRKNLLQRKYIKQIRHLQQKIRRITKKNIYFKKLLVNMRQEGRKTSQTSILV